MHIPLPVMTTGSWWNAILGLLNQDAPYRIHLLMHLFTRRHSTDQRQRQVGSSYRPLSSQGSFKPDWRSQPEIKMEMSWAQGPPEARCSSSFKREQTWNVPLFTWAYLGHFCVPKQQRHKCIPAIPPDYYTVQFICCLLKHTVSRKCEHKQRGKRGWDWVINKYYNCSWIWGILSVLCGEHPVCSLCASVQGPGKPRLTDDIHRECQECRYMNASITHACRAFWRAAELKRWRSAKKKGQQIRASNVTK